MRSGSLRDDGMDDMKRWYADGEKRCSRENGKDVSGRRPQQHQADLGKRASEP